MPGHVFVDESKRRDFILVAAAVPSTALGNARQQIRALHLPQQRGIHMVKESEGRQRRILAVIASLEAEVTVYVATKGTYTAERYARERCLNELLRDIAREGCSTLCLERDDTVAADDRRTIGRQLRAVGYQDSLTYSHSKVWSEPLLLIPDAIAWAWPQKSWKQSCVRLVNEVREV